MINNEYKCCLSWKPIFAGALVAIGLSFLLNLFAVAIELSAFTTTSEGVESLILGGLLATGLGVVASMFAAGWLAGYLGKAHCDGRHLGALYGFLTWCLALLLTIFLADHVQHYVSFYGHFISGSTEVAQVNNPSVGRAVANTVKIATTKPEMKSIMISNYIIFCLFFLSAFACSLGGHCGMRHVCKKDMSC